jgi:chemotaxis protein MotB
MRIRNATAIVAVMLLSVSCVSRSAHMAQVNKARGLAESLDQLEQYLRQFEQENTALRAENARYQKTAADAAYLQEQKDRLARLIAELEKEGGGTGVPGVSVTRNREGDVGLRIEESVLFASGRAEISTAGKSTIARLVPLLTRDGRIIRIEGHTDIDPIQKSSWKSNLHLSAARALAVAEELNRGGVPFDRLFVTGFGPTRPASELPAEKARNRRVELYLQ